MFGICCHWGFTRKTQIREILEDYQEININNNPALREIVEDNPSLREIDL